MHSQRDTSTCTYLHTGTHKHTHIDTLMYAHTYTEGLAPILNNIYRCVSERLIQKVSTATAPLCWELKQRLGAFEGHALPLTLISSPWFWEPKRLKENADNIQCWHEHGPQASLRRRLLLRCWRHTWYPSCKYTQTSNYVQGQGVCPLQFTIMLKNQSISQTKTTALIRICL